MGLRTHTALWASVILLAFFLFGHYFVDPDKARVVVTSCAIGIFLAVVLTWFRRAWHAVTDGIRDGTQNIFVGVWIVAFVMVAYLAWIAFLISSGRPERARTLPVGGVFMVLFFLGGAALYLAPVNTREVIEPVSLRWWLGAGVAGGMVAGSIMTLGLMGIVSLPGAA